MVPPKLPAAGVERASTMSALEAAEALIASMGGPKPPPPPQDRLNGTWDKVRRNWKSVVATGISVMLRWPLVPDTGTV